MSQTFVKTFVCKELLPPVDHISRHVEPKKKRELKIHVDGVTFAGTAHDVRRPVTPVFLLINLYNLHILFRIRRFLQLEIRICFG